MLGPDKKHLLCTYPAHVILLPEPCENIPHKDVVIWWLHRIMYEISGRERPTIFSEAFISQAWPRSSSLKLQSIPEELLGSSNSHLASGKQMCEGQWHLNPGFLILHSTVHKIHSSWDVPPRNIYSKSYGRTDTVQWFKYKINYVLKFELTHSTPITKERCISVAFLKHQVSHFCSVS